jgi:hypothetical protein
MKITGIVLIVLGGILTLTAIVGAAQGYQVNFSGVALLVLGAFLISRANRKKEEAEKKRKWEEGQ